MNLADEPRKLAELREAGHLTDQEFADAKRRLIADAGAEPPPLPRERQTVPSGVAPPPKQKLTVPSRVEVPTSQKKWGCIFGLILVLVIFYMCQQANRSGSKSSSSASRSNAPAASATSAPAIASATPAASPTNATRTP